LQVLQVLEEGWWCDTFQATLGRSGEQCQALFMCSTQHSRLFLTWAWSDEKIVKRGGGRGSQFTWSESALPRVQFDYLSLFQWRRRRRWRLPNQTIIASYTVHMCEVPTNLLIFFLYYFPYISNSCTSCLRGVTLHSCHSGYGPWCTTFSEGDHYGLGQTYEQRKRKTTLSFLGGQFVFSKYR
jgi:hypothetical protein